MGLDMYLNAERFYWHGDPRPNIPEIPKDYTLQTITVEAGYWRKANYIHQWFVENVQGGEDECRPHFVSRDQLETLRDLCKEVLADRSKAPDLLPAQSGVFFGGTDYDNWYFEGLQYTVDLLGRVLKDFPADRWDFEYRSSW